MRAARLRRGHLDDTSCALGSNTSKLLSNLRGPVQNENAGPPFQKMENFNMMMAESQPQAAPSQRSAWRWQESAGTPGGRRPLLPARHRQAKARGSPFFLCHPSPMPQESRREQNPEKGLRGDTAPTSAVVVCNQGTPWLGWNYIRERPHWPESHSLPLRAVCTLGTAGRGPALRSPRASPATFCSSFLTAMISN